MKTTVRRDDDDADEKGQLGADQQEAFLAAVEREQGDSSPVRQNYESAVTAGPGLRAVDSDPHVLPRVPDIANGGSQRERRGPVRQDFAGGALGKATALTNNIHRGSSTAGSGPQPQRPPESGSQEYLTIAEAAAVLRLHPRTLREYVRRGELQGRLIGGRWRFRRQDLDAFFDAAPLQWERYRKGGKK